MAIFISGVAGFIGSRLARHFIDQGIRVVGFDDLSRGHAQNIDKLVQTGRFAFEIVDISDAESLNDRFLRHHSEQAITEVWHMAANSDIPAGIEDATRDLRDTFLTTFNLLKVMRIANVPFLAFASSSAVYGDLGDTPITEDAGPLLPISNYGAMKLASEAVISAAVESWLPRANLFRFPNVIGVPATHGVILDFVRKLKESPGKLTVLGSGRQQKSYLHLEDLVDAMLTIGERSSERLGYYNIGPSDMGVTVRFIAEQTVAVVSPGAHIEYGNEDRGWIGDVPRFTYCNDKLRSLGWEPKLGSSDAVLKAIKEIVEQEASA